MSSSAGVRAGSNNKTDCSLNKGQESAVEPDLETVAIELTLRYNLLPLVTISQSPSPWGAPPSSYRVQASSISHSLIWKAESVRDIYPLFFLIFITPYYYLSFRYLNVLISISIDSNIKGFIIGILPYAIVEAVKQPMWSCCFWVWCWSPNWC